MGATACTSDIVCDCTGIGDSVVFWFLGREWEIVKWMCFGKEYFMESGFKIVKLFFFFFILYVGSFKLSCSSV